MLGQNTVIMRALDNCVKCGHFEETKLMLL